MLVYHLLFYSLINTFAITMKKCSIKVRSNKFETLESIDLNFEYGFVAVDSF